ETVGLDVDGIVDGECIEAAVEVRGLDGRLQPLAHLRRVRVLIEGDLNGDDIALLREVLLITGRGRQRSVCSRQRRVLPHLGEADDREGDGVVARPAVDRRIVVTVSTGTESTVKRISSPIRAPRSSAVVVSRTRSVGAFGRWPETRSKESRRASAGTGDRAKELSENDVPRPVVRVRADSEAVWTPSTSDMGPSRGATASPPTKTSLPGLTVRSAGANDRPTAVSRLFCREELMMRVVATNPAARAIPRPIARKRAQWIRICARATAITERSIRSGR